MKEVFRMIKVKAQKIKQKNMVFYSFVLNSTDLLTISYVSRRYQDSKLGIQRALSEERLVEIAKYLKEDKNSMFPTNLVLCFDDKVKYEQSTENDQEGYLSIPKEKNIAQIIDGQHRLFGSEKSKMNLDFLCVGFLNIDFKKAAKIFLTINSKQRGINTSLVYELFKITRQSDTVTLLAVDIVEELTNDKDSPWYGNVKKTDKAKGLISQAAFVNALREILKNKNIVFSYKLDIRQQALILKNYFSAVKKIFNNEWGSRKHVLTKTLGLNALMYLFPKLHNECLYEQDILGNKTFEKYFDKLKKKNFTFSSNNLGALGGKKGAQTLENMIWEEIK